MDFINLKNPTEKVNDNLFKVKIKKNLSSSKKEKYLLICDPNIKRKAFLENLIDYIKKGNQYTNIVYFNRYNKEVNGLPFFINNIFGNLASLKSTLQLHWNASSSLEKILFLIGCILLLALLQIASIVVTYVIYHPKNNLIFPSFLELQSIISYVIGSLLEMCIPFIFSFLIIKKSKTTYKNILINKFVQNNLELLKEDKYNVALKIFKKRYLVNPGPILVIIDSIDDYYNDYDCDISAKLLDNLDKYYGSVCVLFINTNLIMTRLDLLKKYPDLHFYKVSSKALDEVNNEQTDTVNENIIQDKLEEQFNLYSVSYWNASTLFQFLSVSQYISLYGFKPDSIKDLIEQSKDTLYEYFSSVKFDNSLAEKKFNILFEDLLKTVFFEKYIYKYPFHGTYALDPLVSKLIYKTISKENKFLYNAVYFIVYSNYLLTKRNDLILLDLLRIIDLMVNDLRNNSLLQEKNILNGISLKLLQYFKGSNLSNICKKAAMMYMVTREKSIDEIINENDLLSLESFILYHESTIEDIDLMLEIMRSNNIDNIFVDILKMLKSKDKQIIEELSFDPNNMPKTTRSFYDWLLAEKNNQYLILPNIVDNIINGNYNELNVDYYPKYAGGFNFSTLHSLSLIFALNYSRDTQNFIQILKILSKGIIRTKNSFPENSENIEKYWARALSVFLLVEYIDFVQKNNQEKEIIIEGYKRSLTNINQITVNEYINKLLYFLNIDVQLEKDKYIPIKLFHYLENELKILKLEAILKELNGMESLINFYSLRVTISFRSFNDLEKNDIVDLFKDISNYKSISTLARKTLYIEYLIVEYFAYYNIHRYLLCDIIEEIIIELENNGCKDEVLNSICGGYIEILRFNNNPGNAEKAIKLKLKRWKRIRDEKLILDSLYLAEYFAILAFDFKKIGKMNFARICLQKSINAFQSYAGEINDEYLGVDILIFIVEYDIRMLSPATSKGKIIKYLKSVSCFNMQVMFEVLLVALDYEDLIISGLLTNVATLKNADDWVAGYKWSLIFYNLVSKIQSNNELIHNKNVEKLLMISFFKLKKSDQAQIPIDEVIESIQIIKNYYSAYLKEEFLNELNNYEYVIIEIKMEMIFYATIKNLLLKCQYSKIIDAYYGVFKYELSKLLDGDVRKYLLDPIITQLDYEYGLKLLEKYNQNKETLWIRLFLLNHLLSYATYCKNEKLISKLTEEFKYLDYDYIESMITRLSTAPFLNDKIKNILNSHIKHYSNISK